jgi:DMSO reductase family type II enzyme heme b subunit
MECPRIKTTVDEMLDPDAGPWSALPVETIKLTATPLANQPSEYIKASRNERAIGRVATVAVQAAHNGSDIFFRLSWPDPEPNREITDTNVFPDGCGVLMPLAGGDPPIDEMGSKDAPVNAWFWRADRKDHAANVRAAGLGTTTYSEKCYVRARSVWRDGSWSVVFARPLVVRKQRTEAVQLAAGAAVRVGFAIWEGANGERGGLKSFSKEWRELALQA